MKKYIPFIFYAPLVFIAVVALTFLYWNIQPTDVIKPNNSPYPVRPSATDPLGVEVVTINYCKLIGVNGTVGIRFVGNKSIVRSPDASERGGKGCQKRDIPILLPPQVADDIFYIEFESVYKINPITKVIEISRSQEFRVK